MFKKITTAFMALCLCFLTACGSGEPASAPNVNSDEKSAVQEKLDSSDSANLIWNMRELMQIFESDSFSEFFFKIQNGTYEGKLLGWIPLTLSTTS